MNYLGNCIVRGVENKEEDYFPAILDSARSEAYEVISISTLIRIKFQGVFINLTLTTPAFRNATWIIFFDF